MRVRFDAHTIAHRGAENIDALKGPCHNALRQDHLRLVEMHMFRACNVLEYDSAIEQLSNSLTVFKHRV